MTEYIPFSKEVDALAVNPNISITKCNGELYFEYTSLNFEPLASRTALTRFENQVESDAMLLAMVSKCCARHQER